VKIGGDLVGGAQSYAGRITVSGRANTIFVGRSIFGGSASGNQPLIDAGFVGAQQIGSLTVGGSIYAGTDNTSGQFSGNGAVNAGFDIGSVTVNGSLVGNSTNRAVISAYGQPNPVAGHDVAIGSVTIKGDADQALILAGVDYNQNPLNADAQIGTVTIGGDWIMSSVAAGVTPVAPGFYGFLDAKMSGPNVKDNASFSSKIKSVTIAGQALGSPGGLDFYGFVAEEVGAVRIGGTPLHLTAGAHDDNLIFGPTGDDFVHEV